MFSDVHSGHARMGAELRTETPYPFELRILAASMVPLLLAHGLEFVQRRRQPFQSTIVRDEIEME